MDTRVGSWSSCIRIAGWAVVLATLMASSVSSQSAGNGLYGEYYNNINFTGTLAVRTDPVVDFDWGAANPPAPATLPAGITPPDTFSVRWRGEIEATASETYTFFLTSDDGSRLYLDGSLLIDNWRDQGPTTMSATFPMTAGRPVPIMVEYYENGGGAMVRLEWNSLSTPRAVVPQSQLRSAAPAAAPTVTPDGGLLPSSVTLESATPGASIHYTLDGRDPGLSAPAPGARLYSGPFSIGMSYVRVVARAYAPGTVPSNPTTSKVFSPLFEPVALPAGAVPGLFSRYYHLANPQVVPDFEPLIPQRRSIVPNFTIILAPPRDRNDQFGFKTTGYVNVPTEGMWTFLSSSDDGSKLAIGPHEVVVNDGLHGFPGPSPSGVVALKAGWHPITSTMFENGGGEALAVQWQGPGMAAPAAIPAASLATEPAAATPAAAPAGGAFAGSQQVTLTSATAGATIHYTTDGTAPDPRSATGSGASGLSVTVAATTRLRALATAPGLHPSDVLDVTFTRSDAPPEARSVSAAGVPTEVLVVFDRPVAAPSASNPANYSVSNGVTVSGAALLPKTGALRGHWRLDDPSGSDSSGNGNAASFVNGPVPDAASAAPVGFSNPASLPLDGTDDHASVPDSATLNFGPSSFTVCLWIRPADTTNRRVLNKWDGPGDKGWIMDVNSTAGNLRFRVDDGPNSTDLNVGAGVAADQWQHVAGRCDRVANQISIFRNGARVATANLSTAFGNADTAVPLLMGRLENPPGTASGNHFNGRLDDVRIYGAALSDAEIAGLAAGAEQVSSAVRLTTSALSAGTPYTLTVRNVQDVSGNAVPAAGAPSAFQYFPAGTITREVWTGIGGTTVADLARNANFPNNPSSGSRPALFEAPVNFADNFGSRFRGFFIPNASGNWKFSVASDDNGQLWLSRDDDPSAKVLISRCTAWSASRDFADPDITQSPPIPLTAGRKYYLEAYYKEGGGGDNLAVAAKPDDGTPIAAASAPVPGSMLAPYDDAVVILAQPAARTVQAGHPAAFSVSASGAGPLGYQWRKDGANLAGATGAALSFAAAAPSDAGVYSVVVSNGINSVTSLGAALSVAAVPGPSLDAVAPSFGPAYGGQTLTVTGTNLLPGQALLQVGGAAAANPCFSPDGTRLIVRTPSRAGGAADVTVSTPGGSDALVGAFTYYDLPSSAAISPAAGPAAGGQTVSITGTDFVPGQTSVSFGGTDAANVQVTGPTSLTAVTPPRAAGTVAVTIATPVGSSSRPDAYTYHDPPAIAAVSPANGPAAGGQTVTLEGANFVASQTTVAFGGVSAAITSLQPDRLVVTAPPHAAGSVAVTVTTPGGQATGAYAYHDPPTIASLVPPAGPTAGGQAVRVNGTNFVAGSTSVAFGNAAAPVQALAPDRIDVSSPPQARGPADVVVTTPGGTARATGAYTYYDPPVIASISPGAGRSAGGETVTLTGAHFAPGQTAVTFGGAAASSVTVSPDGTALSASSPAHAAGAVDVEVVTPGGSTRAPAAFTYHDPPSVSSVSPAGGATQGGQTVTLTGSNFVPGQTRVGFGGAEGTGVAVSGSGSLTVNSPPHATGSVDVVVTTPGGSATAAAAYTYSGPFIAGVDPVAGPVAGGQSVRLSGTGFVPGGTSVTFGNSPAAVGSATPNALAVTSPPGAAAGSVDVTVTTPDGTYTAAGAYAYVGSPTIAGVEPARGPSSGGATATIVGSNFAPGNTAVTFGGAPAAITSSTVERIVVTTPQHAGGPVDVVVTTFGNQVATAAGAYTYVPAPAVASVVPARGPTSGGQAIAILGSGFEPGQTSVVIGGSAAVAVVVDPGGSRLTARTSAHGAGTFDVTVATFERQSATRPAAYTYVDPSSSTDLALTKDASTTTPVLGEQVRFDIGVLNSGGIDATGVEVTDLLPAGLAFVSGSASQGAYDLATGVWTVGSLPRGGAALLSIFVTVESSAPIVNVAEVTASDLPDVDSTAGNGVDGEDDRAAASLEAALSIRTQAPLPSATSGAPYFMPFVAGAGVPPYRWSLESGSLPLNLDPLSGRVSGTAPLVAATAEFTFTLSVSDSQEPPAVHARTFTLSVHPATAGAPVVKTLPAPENAIRGSSYAHEFTAAEGRPPYAWSLAGGALPPGTFLNPRTGLLGGAATAPGSFPFRIQATDSAGLSATGDFTLVVEPNPVRMEVRALPEGSVGAPYHQELEAAGGLGPTFAWSVAQGTLPGGLTLAGTGRTGTLSGTPAAAGTFSFSLRISDDGQPGVREERPFTVSIAPSPGTGSAPPLVVTTDRLPEGSLGRPYAAQLTAAGGRVPYRWSVVSGRLPSGVALDSPTGRLAGTPAEDGYFPVTVQATGSGSAPGADLRSLVVVVAPPVIFADGIPIAPAVRGEAYYERLAARGGVPPYRWGIAAGTLPAGLTLSPSSGVLSGVPTGAGSTFTVEATDGRGAFASGVFTLNAIDPAAGLAVVTQSLPRAHVAVPYSVTLGAVGGTSPHAWSLASGTLPPWAGLEQGTGAVSGQPSSAGLSVVTFQATDASGPPPAGAPSASLILEGVPPLAVADDALPDATESLPYSGVLRASGSVGAVYWTVLDGTLPEGFSVELSTGTVSGSTALRGTTSLRVRATDGLGRTADRRVSFTVGHNNPAGSSGRECSAASVPGGGPWPPGAGWGILVLPLLAALFLGAGFRRGPMRNSRKGA